MVQPRIRPVWVFAFAGVWALWCYLALVVLVPVLERHLHLHRALTAWFLCLLPGAAAVIGSAIRLQKA
jgi:hypothetical protein